MYEENPFDPINWKSLSKELVEASDSYTWQKLLRDDVIKEVDKLLNDRLLHSDFLSIDRKLFEDALFFALNMEIEGLPSEYVTWESGEDLEFTEENLQTQETVFIEKKYGLLKYKYLYIATILINSFNKSDKLEKLMRFYKQKRNPLYKKADEIHQKNVPLSYVKSIEKATKYFPEYENEDILFDLERGYRTYRSRKKK